MCSRISHSNYSGHITHNYSKSHIVRRVAEPLDDVELEIIKRVNAALRQDRILRSLIISEDNGHSYDSSAPGCLLKQNQIRHRFGVELDRPETRLFEVGIGGGTVIITYGFLLPSLTMFGVEESSDIFSTFKNIMLRISDKPASILNAKLANMSFLAIENEYESLQITNLTMYVFFDFILSERDY